MGDENPIHTLGDYSKPSHEGYRNIIELPEGNNVVPLRSDTIRLVQNGCSFHRLRVEDQNQHLKDFVKLVDSLDLNGDNRERMRMLQIFYDHVNTATRRTIDQSAGGKLHDRNAEESWALLEDLALYDNESWNDPRDFDKPVKAISLPQDVSSTSDRRLIELENQIQRLMESHLAPKQHVQVNKITSSCEIFSGPHDTQYYMENPKQAFVEYASSRIDEVRGKWYTFKPEQNNLGALPSDTIKNPKLNVNYNSPVLSACSYLMKDPWCSSHPPNLINAVKTCSKEINHSQKDQLQTTRDSKPFDTLADLGDCVNIISLYLFKKLNIGLLEETGHVFGLADGTKPYSVGIVRDVEVHIGRVKLLNDFYIIAMKKDLETPLLVGRGFLATTNAVIDFRKAKIAIGEGITSSDGVGARTPYYAKKEFIDCHLLDKLEIARDAEINPF
ncbi:MAK10-like protein, partial [Tanacetum coccineum]